MNKKQRAAYEKELEQTAQQPGVPVTFEMQVAWRGTHVRRVFGRNEAETVFRAEVEYMNPDGTTSGKKRVRDYPAFAVRCEGGYSALRALLLPLPVMDLPPESEL